MALTEKRSLPDGLRGAWQVGRGAGSPPSLPEL